MFEFLKKKNNSKDSDKDDSEVVKEILDFIQDYQNVIELLIIKLDFVKEAGEMLPPWIVKIYPKEVPLIDKLSINSPLFNEDYWYWRGGEGGRYRARFLQFLSTLSLQQKKCYFTKYDLGTEWPERGHYFIDVFKYSGSKILSSEELEVIEREVLNS